MPLAQHIHKPSSCSGTVAVAGGCTPTQPLKEVVAPAAVSTVDTLHPPGARILDKLSTARAPDALRPLFAPVTTTTTTTAPASTRRLSLKLECAFLLTDHRVWRLPHLQPAPRSHHAPTTPLYSTPNDRPDPERRSARTKQTPRDCFSASLTPCGGLLCQPWQPAALQPPEQRDRTRLFVHALVCCAARLPAWPVLRRRALAVACGEERGVWGVRCACAAWTAATHSDSQRSPQSGRRCVGMAEALRQWRTVPSGLDAYEQPSCILSPVIGDGSADENASRRCVIPSGSKGSSAEVAAAVSGSTASTGCNSPSDVATGGPKPVTSPCLLSVPPPPSSARRPTPRRCDRSVPSRSRHKSKQTSQREI
eukprot:350834-Chlamydomonas_euryale.AAC.5